MLDFVASVITAFALVVMLLERLWIVVVALTEVHYYIMIHDDDDRNQS